MQEGLQLHALQTLHLCDYSGAAVTLQQVFAKWPVESAHLCPHSYTEHPGVSCIP
jgi:hypothetical protein